MLREFTFITLSFNHERYIKEHLESIKTLIIKYGKDIEIHYYLADDGSSDKTIDIVKDWIDKEENRTLFASFEISGDGVNRGTVQNLIRALSLVKTEELKFLAGDDKYYDSDIFSAIESAGDEIILTPCVPTKRNETIGTEFARKYRLLLMEQKHGRIKNLLEYDNFIQAPGALIPGKYLMDEELFEELKAYKLIEDYPMWWYFFIKKEYPVSIEVDPFICYRMESGVSRDKGHCKHTAYDEDLALMRKLLPMGKIKLPAFINPERVWMAAKLAQHKAKKEEINKEFACIPELRDYVIE